MEKGQIELEFCPAANMTALDILTKALPKPKHHIHSTELGLSPLWRGVLSSTVLGKEWQQPQRHLGMRSYLLNSIYCVAPKYTQTFCCRVSSVPIELAWFIHCTFRTYLHHYRAHNLYKGCGWSQPNNCCWEMLGQKGAVIIVTFGWGWLHHWWDRRAEVVTTSLLLLAAGAVVIVVSSQKWLVRRRHHWGDAGVVVHCALLPLLMLGRSHLIMELMSRFAGSAPTSVYSNSDRLRFKFTLGEVRPSKSQNFEISLR